GVWLLSAAFIFNIGAWLVIPSATAFLPASISKPLMNILVSGWFLCGFAGDWLLTSKEPVRISTDHQRWRIRVVAAVHLILSLWLGFVVARHDFPNYRGVLWPSFWLFWMEFGLWWVILIARL